MKNSKTSKMILCALFAALTAILSQIVIPIGPVPINMATFAVFCAGTLLGSRLGTLSIAIWAALGIAGIPVFTMFRSGIGTLIGPTGGYIIGYFFSAFLIGLITEKFNKENKIYIYSIAMLAGAFTYFILGTLWYMFLTNSSLAVALGLCVIPFIPGDLLKIALASLLTKNVVLQLNKNV